MIAIIKKLTTLGSIIAAAATVFAVSAVAHHSFTAEFDERKPIKMTGKITEMRWSNPHGWIYVDVKGADGKTVNWALETGGANALYRRGWRKEDLPVGAEVSFEGWQARNGSNTANVNSLTLKDGRRLFAGTSNANGQQ
jgi:hypothetical protein